MTTSAIRHVQPSLVLSLDDEVWQPSPRLLDLAAAVAALAPVTEHPILDRRNGASPHWYRQFPGEHYHLLTAICRLLKPALVWEFGTDTGMSTIAMLEGLEPEARIVTVDIDCWRTKRGPWLTEDDFTSGRVTQVVSDMKSPALFAGHQDSLRQAEMIFVDGPKDGTTEQAFLEQLGQVPFLQNPIIVFDDIRLMHMVHIWRDIQHPKMDMTSFGHWSGTGLVDWHSTPAPQPAAPQPAAPLARPMTKPGTPLTVPHAASPARSDPVISRGETTRILMLCHEKPNYVPDLLLHGLRKLLGTAFVDFPRKHAVYDGCLGQAYLDKIPGLMAADDAVDRTDIQAKLRTGFFDLVLCDIRAINANRGLLQDSATPLALIDGEDRPAPIRAGNYVILRRETDGNDFSLPLQMGMPVEVLDWIGRHADAPKTHSIAFLGSRSKLTPDRNAVLDELCRIFPDAMIDSWDMSEGQWRGRDACYRAMQSCKAVLNLPGAGSDTFRYWENAACNAAHVAKHMPLFIPNDFRDGQEIIRFRNPRELIDIVGRIISDDIDWQGLAARSGQWLRAHHTTERRAAMILDRLNVAFLR